MWYKVRARDNRIFKPDGKVLTFSIWADSDEKFWELMKEKKPTEVEILGKTTEPTDGNSDFIIYLLY